MSSALAAAPANLDAFLSHLHRCFQTPSGADTVLLFLCYNSRLAANTLDAASRSALAGAVQRLLARLRLDSLPMPGALTTQAVSSSLRALSALLSDFRAFTRLWGLLGMYQWAKRLVAQERARRATLAKGEKPTPGSDLDRTIAWAQLTACVIFQSMENLSFLGQKKIVSMKPKTIGALLLWSTRFWAVHVGLELGRLFVEKSRKEKERIAGAALGKGTQPPEYRAWRAGWNRSLAGNLAWAPLTVHWSMEKGFVNEPTLAFLASVPGIIQIRQLWKETA